LFAFIAMVFLGDRCLAWIAGNVVKRSQNTFVKMYEGKAKADVLLLGNSRMDRNVDPAQLKTKTGLTALNLGLGGNHTLISECLFFDYISRYGPPQLLLIEVTQTVDSPADLGEMGVFANESPRLASLIERMDPTFATARKLFHCLTFNNDTFWRLLSEVVSAPKSRLLTKTLSNEELERLAQKGALEWPEIKENMEALSRITKFAAENQIPTRLFIAPMWTEFKRNISNFDEWKVAVQKAAKQPVLDYSDIFSDRRELFNDGNHLNSAGAAALLDRMEADRALKMTTSGSRSWPVGRPE
jgi:hypothetical protein